MKLKHLLCSMFAALVLAALPAYAQKPTINPGGVCENQVDSLTGTYLCAPSSTLIDQTYLAIYGNNFNGLESVTFSSSETGTQSLPIESFSTTQIDVCLKLTETNITNGTLTINTGHGSSAPFSSINVTTWQPAYGMTKCTT
jgi:hypothetical protein